MKENSIEEDIKILEELRISNENCIKNAKIKDNPFVAIWEKQNRAIEHILSDYKRLLKENEQLSTEANSSKKENEELKNDYENLSNSVVVKNHCIKNSIPVSLVKDKIEEIQEEGYWLFTTDRDSDKCVEVLQQLLESEKKMNEEDKQTIKYIKSRLYGNEGCDYIDVAQEDLKSFVPGIVIENIEKDCIPIQKIKDKIRHYQELQDNYIKKYDEINEGLQAMINVLQELIEGRKHE